MRSFFLRGLAALLFGACLIPAQAGVFANISATETWHSTWEVWNDGRPALPLEGTLASNLVQLKYHNSCRAFSMSGALHSWCDYEADFSGIDSPYVNEFKSRFKANTPLLNSLAVDLDVWEDGTYFGIFFFTQGNTEIFTDETGTYQSTLNTNYQFWFQGNGLAPDSVVDLDFVKRIWGEGAFTKQYFMTQWDVLQLFDQGDPVLLDFELWEGNFVATTGTIPEPSAPLLFAAGLIALAGQRAAKRRAGIVRRDA